MSEEPTTGGPEELLCPVCWEPLVTVVRHGVHVEHCPEHGVWLERGELETIVRRTVGELEGYWGRAVIEEREMTHEDRDLEELIGVAGDVVARRPGVRRSPLAPKDRAHLEREYGPGAQAPGWIDSLLEFLLRRWP